MPMSTQLFTMMELLGIDMQGDSVTVDRTWSGVNSFLEDKLAELEKIMPDKREETGSKGEIDLLLL